MTMLSCAEVRDRAEGYVLDALEEDERLAVRAHLETCTAAHAEFDELHGVVAQLSHAIEPVEPPPALRDRLISAAAAEARAERRGQPVAPPAAVQSDAVRPWQIDSVAGGAHRRSPLVWAAALTAVVLIFALAGLASVQQAELEAAREYERGVATLVELAADAGTRLAVLENDAGVAYGLAAVGADGRVALAVQGLPQTSGSEVYEAWLITDGGPPLPIGGFRVGAGGVGSLVTDAPASDAEIVVALTREPAPGATTPTGPIVAAGTPG